MKNVSHTPLAHHYLFFFPGAFVRLKERERREGGGSVMFGYELFCLGYPLFETEFQGQ